MVNITMKMLTHIKRTVFVILQCTWGIIPTLVGLCFFIKLKNYPNKSYRGCVDTQWNTRSGLSLGLFIFTPNDEIKDSDKIRVHEYGHSIQSIVLGPLFVIIGIISLVWGGIRIMQSFVKKRSFYIPPVLWKAGRASGGNWLQAKKQSGIEQIHSYLTAHITRVVKWQNP